MDEGRTAALLPPACGRVRLPLPLPDGGAEPVEKRHRRRWQAVRLARSRLLDGPGRDEGLVHRDGIARCVGRVGEVGDSSRAGALVGELLLEVSTLRPPKDHLRGTERGGRGIPFHYPRPPALSRGAVRSEASFAVLRTIRSCRTIQHPDGTAGGAVEAIAALARSHGKGAV
jgi:hypothetical protein